MRSTATAATASRLSGLDLQSSCSHLNRSMKTGSFWGPLLFNIYMYDLNLFFYSRYLIAHADDTTAYASHTSPVLLESIINSDLVLIYGTSLMHDYYIYYFMLKQSCNHCLFMPLVLSLLFVYYIRMLCMYPWFSYIFHVLKKIPFFRGFRFIR